MKKSVMFVFSLVLLMSFVMVVSAEIMTVTNGSLVCTDYEGEVNYYIKGTVRSALNVTTEDLCVNSTLLNEHSCPSSQYLSAGTHIAAYYCPIACSNGACVNQTTTATCTDSDNGDNYYTKGTVHSALNVTTSDQCINSTTLNEHSCPENVLHGTKISVYLCPNGCSNGVCISSASNVSACTDSDGGKTDYYVKGTVHDEREDPESYSDFCYDDYQLFEHGCGDLGYSAGLYTCPNGCNNGACKYCIDSDNEDYSVRGYRLNKNPSFEDYNLERYDYCILNPEVSDNGNVIADEAKKVNSCSGGDCYVIEYICRESDLSDAHRGYLCSKGCNEGKCTQAIEPENICHTFQVGQDRIHLNANGVTGSQFCSDTNKFCSQAYVKHEIVTENSAQDGYFSCDVLHGPENVNFLQVTCCDNSIPCSDTDSGKDYYVKGQTTQDGTLYGVDQCEIHGNDSIAIVSSCDGENCFLAETFCSPDVGSTPSGETYSCPEGCSKGACIGGEVVTPSNETGPIELNETDGGAISCSGCILNNNCYPFGYRKSGEYCSETGQFVVQLEVGSCDNDFECSSNLCVSDECVGRNLWQKIMDFFRSLFGG